jgi:hypothetical protein
MLKTDKEKLITAQHIDGEWFYENENINLTVKISGKNISLKGTLNGKSIDRDIVSGNLWTADFLTFDSNNIFVRFANETNLSFGEFKDGGIIGNINWEFLFKRVPSLIK